jgi:lipopolysaccharide/colanic/teichoic acid biosynthesis glycosyltransferase
VQTSAKDAEKGTCDVYEIDVSEVHAKPRGRSARRETRPRPGRNGGRQAGVLRLLDLVIAVVIVLLLAPLMLVIALAILLVDGGPAYSSHRRVGLHGHRFHMLKFRTVALAEARLGADDALRENARVTVLGDFLRKSGLDALPQLFNVLRGEMSLVGPRPIAEAEVRRYGRWFRHYQATAPGMTGMWQIWGRRAPAHRVALDVLYVRRRSLGCNLGILMLSVPFALFLADDH